MCQSLWIVRAYEWMRIIVQKSSKVGKYVCSSLAVANPAPS